MSEKTCVMCREAYDIKEITYEQRMMQGKTIRDPAYNVRHLESVQIV